VREQLKALVQLAEIDSKARGIDDQLQGLPRELEDRRNAVKKLEELVQRQRTSLSDAERLLAQQEIDLATRNEALSKAKSKGAKAKNAREADMAERELDGTRRSIKDGETERDRLKERIEKTRIGLAGPQGSLDEARAELATAEGELEGKLETLRSERTAIVQGREVFVAKIAKEHMRVYDRIVKGKSPPVCEIVNGICSACRMSVAPQRAVQTQKGEILNCQMCQRFLYHRNLFLD
jgi:predicted  nucleic acid-binding Zn-ribbon protein